MQQFKGWAAVLLLALTFTGVARALEVSQTEWDALQKKSKEWDTVKTEVEELRKKNSEIKPSAADKAMSKYGPDAAVTTKVGKLTISGLVQVWYYDIAHDNKGLFDNPNTGVVDSNTTNNGNGFRIRRSEVKFVADVNENATAVIMMDPAREATAGFPSFPTNQGVVKRLPNVSPDFVAGNKAASPSLNGASTSMIANMQSGNGSTLPRLLQDAYITYHGVIPHHEFQVGQFLPPVGEEGLRSSAQLDFVERAMVTQFANNRDMGIQVKGDWWDSRFQYWIGAFDGAGNYFGTAGQNQNRADDNNDKDVALRALVRPLWNHETWGSLELGASSEFGTHGVTTATRDVTLAANADNTLNRSAIAASRHYGWLSYKPNGPVKGLWLRGEYGFMRDRNAPNAVANLFNAGTGAAANGSAAAGWLQRDPGPSSLQGWYGAIGYKISESKYCDSVPSYFKPFELAFRFERFQDTQIANQVDPSMTNAYYTNVFTTGVNYYLKGHNAKIQANYNVVHNPSNGGLFHNENNNSFVVNFQVAF